uniref:ABC transporter domain-containing protein n=1 Tax=Entomoneis paludosa TaxID=265537 RepID=A0A7S2Y2X7_9STRA|mmetsp:Transcript_14350/g.29749  ORF Transcript_14350/g.29749 Transcript_14350/m.29749 type:complete len:636 (+) Transcript_14350:188-2095(+)|eukprot:CAMPEP_0172468110 /NCGR_PEP_ID=MMETSP1065-20121228/60685_1 /TAXON_ID=265537 /ORGANISM="Amphiprora paludosa, Strain CCMP125" /LENGTH=635 /DNA_ID=CAMNT_0013225445 /DNA_START=126 /DNA_END=2033 /DNA_ORIENTATION=+
MKQQDERLKLLNYVLPIMRGIAYPLLKISFIALSEKLLQEALRTSIDQDLFQELEKDVFDSVKSSSMTRLYLLDGLGFYGTLAVSGALVLVLAIIQPWASAMQEYHLNLEEVKRLQSVLYKRFILEPNSVAMNEASDLLYTKISIIEEYWGKSKFQMVGDLTSVIFGLILLLALSWDLGLMYLVGALIIFVLSELLRSNLSSPWAEQRETKTAKTNAHLIDLVICKEVVLTHAQEIQEQRRLDTYIQADRNDGKQLLKAHFITEVFKSITFYALPPLLFLFVFLVDLTMERVFQLLLIIVMTEEIMRSYFAYTAHAEKQEEYQRAQKDFCHVLNMDQADLFPHDFEWPWTKRGGGGSNGWNTAKVAENTESTYGWDEESGRKSGNPALPSPNLDISTLLSNRTTRQDEDTCAIQLQDVSLGYSVQESMYHVADKLNMSFSLGKHYAIMGETGAGKSTVLKVLAGLLPPLQGTILLAGQPLPTTSLLWRQQIGVVSQNSLFLNRSLRENLCYGPVSPVEDKVIWQALEKVNLKTRVQELPQGLDTRLLDNGLEFSGGQRQRLQIARLLLSGVSSQVILLDEPTSALDSLTTDQILVVLQEFLVEKTLIMVTHDVQPLILADTVFQMKCGGDVEYAV